jgi:hypothetical protein
MEDWRSLSELVPIQIKQLLVSIYVRCRVVEYAVAVVLRMVVSAKICPGFSALR